ncbi:carboxymethylenebutenolidase [Kribbella antiqua]|uniref:Carboxymethylenebutenolidase n=1 Tax=Kribbella antiqua TaxID=2512217 RepID=A0A4R2IU06_9ACTN|nr:dienelactone hydrolase family protein [Kribbella antiqua]TCO46325.1 carboxymethylenebutenolidase [Kribbella antiqua]
MGVSVVVGEQEAYLARVGRAGMLLLPMITGIGEQVRAWADELAGEEGITALVWDPFKGRSTDNSSREELSALLQQMDDDAALAEQSQLLDYLFTELGCTKAGVIGWCLGGRFALLLSARDHRVANAIAFHPTVPSELAPHHSYDAIAEAAAITAPVLVSYPSADTLVSNADFQALETALQTRASGATFTQYFPGAEHGFSDKGRHDKAVNADAFRLAWPQALALIKATTGDAR